MSSIKGDRMCVVEQAIDIKSAVEVLHGLDSREINKLLLNSVDFVLKLRTECGSMFEIDVEKLTWSLPLHLLAVLVLPSGDEIRLRYVLCGFRLLHSICGLASQHTKLEHIIFEDVRVADQILDLVFFMLIKLVLYKQEDHVTEFLPLLHSALVACSLHLLTAYISPQWQDLVLVLLAHPEVDVFMDTVFSAVQIDVNYIKFKLKEVQVDAVRMDLDPPDAAITVHILCQQCEASLQFLESLCQQQLFCERLLINKELCKNGGFLSLAHTVLALRPPRYLGEPKLGDAISRLKLRLLSILLLLCEIESISFLDEVAITPKCVGLARSIAIEVVELLTIDFDTEYSCTEESHSEGLILLTSLRLVDIFSDDSNFRNFITPKAAKVLAEILSRPCEIFLSNWCSTDNLTIEEDASLDYDPFLAAGVALASLSLDGTDAECQFVVNKVRQGSTAHQKTSLLVKIIANLHCFFPSFCEEQERNLFLNKMNDCLQTELPKSSTVILNEVRTVVACRNLGYLLEHARSLVPNFLCQEDVFLLGQFRTALENLPKRQELETIPAEDSEIQKELMPSFAKAADEEMLEMPADCLHYQDHLELCKTTRDISLNRNASDLIHEVNKEFQNVKFNSSNFISVRGNNSNEQISENGFTVAVEENENEKEQIVTGDEKQRGKRKRNIMNDKQIELIEQALLDEPEMQRHASLLQTWTKTLSSYGAELTSTQLKNWLNNRKARLLRTVKESIATSDEHTTDRQDGSGLGHFYESPESFSNEMYDPTTTTRRGGNQNIANTATFEVNTTAHPEFTVQRSESVRYVPRCEPGQYVLFLDRNGKEVGTGHVIQVEGWWYGKNLKEMGLCILDVIELKEDRRTELPHPSDATGNTFEDAISKLMAMRVAWDANKIHVLSK